MSKVSKYSVLVYSGEQGYQNNRAQITLADFDAIVSPLSDSKDPGMPCELDTETDGIITMRDRARLPVCQAEAVRAKEPPIWRQQSSGPWQARHGMSAQAYQRVR